MCFSLKTESRGDTEDARLREGEFWKEINSEDIYLFDHGKDGKTRKGSLALLMSLVFSK